MHYLKNIKIISLHLAIGDLDLSKLASKSNKSLDFGTVCGIAAGITYELI